MKRIFCAILILFLFCGCINISIADLPSEVLEVFNCNEYVTLRKEPDTKSKEITKVYKGDLVYFLEPSAKDFYHVQYGSKDGYILAKYLKNTEFRFSDVIFPNQQIYNCNEWVSLRKAPDAKSERLQKVPLGAIVTRVIRFSQDWMYVTYNKSSGYINSSYLRTADYDKIKKEEAARRKAEEDAARKDPGNLFDCMQVVNAESWVSLRITPDTDGKRLAQIPVGAFVTDCLRINADWVFVHYSNMDGYVRSDYLVPAAARSGSDGSDDGEVLFSSFDELAALPPYDAFIRIGKPVCETVCGNFHVVARRTYDMKNEKEELLAVCYDSAGLPLWTARETGEGLFELDATSAFIAGTEDSPCLVTFCTQKGFSARAIDSTGTLLWFSDCVKPGPVPESLLPGGGLTAFVSADGVIYACGYYNEAPVAIDGNGVLLWKAQNPDPMNICWPYEIRSGADGITVLYDSFNEDENTVYAVTYDPLSGICTGFTTVSVPDPYEHEEEDYSFG